MGIRKIRRCKSCGRRFTPRNQKPVPDDCSEAPQAETAESVEPEAADGAEDGTSEAEETDSVEPSDRETATSIESEQPSDEHQTVGP